MNQVVLIVEKNDRIRAAIRQQFLARNVPTFDVSDAFDAMSALGRAEFGAVVAAAGKRQLSLRGLCQLARRRHPGVHIFVIVTQKIATPDVEEMESAVGVQGLQMVPPETTTEQLAGRVVEAMRAPFHGTTTENTAPSAPAPSRIPSTVAIDLEEFGDLPADEELLPSPTGAPASAAPAPLDLPPVPVDIVLEPELPVAVLSEVVLEGRLDGRVGAALLMSLTSQEFTGALQIDSGEAIGELYLYEGDPVWATHPNGDAHLFEQLVGHGHLPPDLQLAPVPAGQLLGHLTQSGHLTGKKIYDFMLAYVRGRVLSLIGQETGGYRFVEDPSFLEVAPLLKVNPFGLVLDSKRQAMTPDRLLTLSSELEWKYLHPLPQLGPSLEELKPFTRGIDVSELINGSRTVRSFCQKTGLDDLMGLLVVLAMADARLVTIEDEPQENTGVVLESTGIRRSSRHPSAEGFDISDTTEAKEAQARLIQLYMQLKPLTAPAQVLGVDAAGLTAETLTAAYQARMAALDPTHVPAGSARSVLQSHVSELRAKVEQAYTTLRSQLG